jgi:hypothetical protein
MAQVKDDDLSLAGDLRRDPATPVERWPLTPYPFKPLKHNSIVAGLALRLLELRNRKLEKLIFTATTGRSGTLTLSKIFSAVPGCASIHEARPVMNGSVLKAASYGDAALVARVYRQVKAVNILRAAVGYRYYVEANHLFIKAFAQHAFEDFGERLAVIHLVRPAVEVATSICGLQDHPGTERGNYWWLDYKAPSNLIPMAEILDSDPEFSHPFYKALWYWHEIEARIAAFHAQTPTLKMVRFETGWFNDLPRICLLLDELGIEYQRSAIARMIGTREHTKESQKIGTALPAGKRAQMASRFEELLATLQVNVIRCTLR